MKKKRVSRMSRKVGILILIFVIFSSILTPNSLSNIMAGNPIIQITEFSFFPLDALTEGTNVTFKAIIKNIYSADISNVNVRLFVDNKLVIERTIPKITKNTSSTQSFMYTIPGNFVGEHTAKIVASVTSPQSEEIKSEKNFKVLPFLADLSITSQDVSISPSAPKTGDTVKFTAKVKNLSGSVTALNVKVTFYLNSLQNEIGVKTIGLIGYFDYGTATLEYKLGTNSSGSQKLIVVVDEDNAIKEINEQNNRAEKSFTVTQALPDLSIGANDVSYTPATLKGGDKVTLKVVVKNLGIVAASNFKVSFYFDEQKIFERSIFALPKSSSTTVTYIYQLPFSISGSKSFVAKVDEQNAVKESNETNNQAQKTIVVNKNSSAPPIVSGLADLSIVPSDISISPSSPKAGDKVTFSAKVRNKGTVSAKDIRVNFYLNDLTNEICVDTIPEINKGGYYTVSYQYTLDTNINSNQKLIVVVDQYNKIKESNEQNNKGEKSFTVTQALPDLSVSLNKINIETVDGQTNPSNIKGGDIISFNARIDNLGATTAENFKVTFYFDGKKIYEEKILQVPKGGYCVIGGLEFLTFPIPVNLSGNKTFLVKVDEANTVKEVNEKNNEAQKVIAISKAQIDLLFESIKPYPTNPKVGDLVEWQIKVKNNGSGDAWNFKINFFADEQPERPTATFFVERLSKNSSITKSVYWTVPKNIPRAIGYTVTGIVDTENTNAETNEINNTYFYGLNLTAPDLTIERCSRVGYVVYPNEPLSACGKVVNDNVMQVNNVKVCFYYQVGNNAPVKIGEKIISSIGKKGATQMQFSNPQPSNMPLGIQYRLIIKVDDGNSIVETNEDNNAVDFMAVLREPPLIPKYPALTIYVLDEEGNSLNGATVKLTDTSTNKVETRVTGPSTGTESAFTGNGYVIFDNRPSQANYKVEISCPNYRTAIDTFAFSENHLTRVYYMDKKAVLSGTIKDSSRQPISGVKVRIEGTGLQTFTDSQGRYGFELNGGSYIIKFTKEGYQRVLVNNFQIAPLSNVTLDKTMTPATKAYFTGRVMNEDGDPLIADIYQNNTKIGSSTSSGDFNFEILPGNDQTFEFRKPTYVTVKFKETIVAGEEYDHDIIMARPSTENHVERGAQFVSWHQHEGTPSNAFFIPEYNVDVWWGLGRVKMSLDFTKSSDRVKLTKLSVTLKGEEWECHRVEGEGEIEGSAIDIPIKVAAGGCSSHLTRIDIYKIAIESNGQEVWSNSGFFSTASDPENSVQRTFNFDNLQVTWDNSFKIKVWFKVMDKQTESSGALAGYHMDRKLITWYPQKPPTTKISTSWGQIGGYFLGILDNPLNAFANFTDLFTVEKYNQFEITEVMQENFP